MKKWLRMTIGCLALALGLIGLVTPILPGWILISIGMLLLSRHVPLFERWLEQLEQRVPACRPHFHKVRRWLD